MAVGLVRGREITAMLGWLSEASSLASRSNRARRSGSCCENSLGQDLHRDLAAERRVLGAFQTTPIPPSPSFSTRR